MSDNCKIETTQINQTYDSTDKQIKDEFIGIATQNTYSYLTIDNSLPTNPTNNTKKKWQRIVNGRRVKR